VSFNMFPRNHLYKVIISLLCVIVWRFEATKNLSKHGVLILTFSYVFFVKMILDLCVNYHRRNNSKYLLSMDNWYSIMWHINYLSSLHWLLLLITLLSLAKKCICFNSRCLPWLLWFHLILLHLFCVTINEGRDDDPICVHFVFKWKIINNALILGVALLYLL
jgi:hypothetical protein